MRRVARLPPDVRAPRPGASFRVEGAGGSLVRNRTMEKPKSGKKPFFARFLESQELAKVNAGGTLKYPSDRDELDHTMKYPSDGDETANDV